MIDTNVTALASLTHKLLPGLIARRGAIINLSSVAANYPYAGGNVYSRNQGVREGVFARAAQRSARHRRARHVDRARHGRDRVHAGAHGRRSRRRQTTLYRGAKPMTGEDIAATMLWVAELPPHLNINRLELMPVSQSFAGFQVARAT